MSFSKEQVQDSILTHLKLYHGSGVHGIIQSETRETTPHPQSTEQPSVAKAPTLETQTMSLDQVKTLDELQTFIGPCQRCKLCEQRQNIVFGAGNPQADLMFVGEGPGADEDAQGIPFVGRAGKLLSKIIEAMNLTRDQVYIANVVKCRPPNNRNPETDEIASCFGFLKRQIELIHPKVVVCLGKFAAQNVLNSQVPISKMRGRFQKLGDYDVMPAFHPAYLLRNPSAKKIMWEDMQQVMKKLGQ